MTMKLRGRHGVPDISLLSFCYSEEFPAKPGLATYMLKTLVTLNSPLAHCRLYPSNLGSIESLNLPMRGMVHLAPGRWAFLYLYTACGGSWGVVATVVSDTGTIGCAADKVLTCSSTNKVAIMAKRLPKTCLFIHPPCCPKVELELPSADHDEPGQKEDEEKTCRLISSAVLANNPNLASESATSEGRGREERALGVAVARVAACETFCMAEKKEMEVIVVSIARSRCFR
jgi:hypothetical protein